MTGSINQVENVLISVLSIIYNTDSLRLNGDSPFSLKVHIIENLRLHLAFCKKTGHLYNSVGKGRLTVIYMRYYAEVPYVFLVYGHCILRLAVAIYCMTDTVLSE